MSFDFEINTRSTNLVFTQVKASISLGRYDVLNDNKSTSNNSFEKKFVQNIRPFKWTLVLNIQAGVCRVSY